MDFVDSCGRLLGIAPPVFRDFSPKFFYYLHCISRELLPSPSVKKIMSKAEEGLSDQEWELVRERVGYYNKLSNVDVYLKELPLLADFRIPSKTRVYYFDTFEYSRYFPKQLRMKMVPGDVVRVPVLPSIVKSRPINGDNANSVLLNLDKHRHFRFVNDPIDFRDKKDILVGRAVVRQANRIRFYRQYFGHPLCDLGQINKDKNMQWVKPVMSIGHHLHHKFILSLEGNDVATNLKWVMSSNSIAVMPRPKFETWFMEGKLKPNYHYIEIKDDFSDLEAQLNHYIANPDEAEAIVRNAHAYISQFSNPLVEDVTSILVLDKYFKETGQKP